MSYRVKTVASMTGIPRPTLLAWERRYDILEPRRSPTGHRIYTEDDVAVLRDLKARVDAGLSIGEAVRLRREAKAERPAPASSAPTELVSWLIGALLEFDRTSADRLAPRLRQLTFQQQIDDVFLPILRRIGDDWATGQVSVAQEHFASAWCREQLFAIFHGLGAGPEGGPEVVCALAPGEVHELGLLGVALHLALSGWRVTWLGADLPIDELCELARARRPNLVCLSLMMEHGPGEAEGWIRRLREAAPDRTIVAVGGRAAGCDVPGVITAQDGKALLDALRAGHP